MSALAWTARRFFTCLSRLGRLTIVSHSGPTTFKAFCELDELSIANGHLSVVDKAYHWHLRLDGFGHVLSRDKVHTGSQRRALFFELRREAASKPFLKIYLHTAVGQDLDPGLAARFAELHRELGQGRQIDREGA